MAQPTPTGVDGGTVTDGRVIAEEVAGKIVSGRGNGRIGGVSDGDRSRRGARGGRSQVHGTLGTAHVGLHGVNRVCFVCLFFFNSACYCWVVLLFARLCTFDCFVYLLRRIPKTEKVTKRTTKLQELQKTGIVDIKCLKSLVYNILYMILLTTYFLCQ